MGNDILAMSFAAETACVVRTAGRLECGRAVAGARLPFAPRVVDVGGPVRTVASGFAHSCAATTSGAVACFGGFNIHGELGATTQVSSDDPVSVPGISDAIEVGAGSSFSCALRRGDRVTCWGQGSKGQLGPRAGEPGPVDVKMP